MRAYNITRATNSNCESCCEADQAKLGEKWTGASRERRLVNTIKTSWILDENSSGRKMSKKIVKNSLARLNDGKRLSMNKRRPEAASVRILNGTFVLMIGSIWNYAC